MGPILSAKDITVIRGERTVLREVNVDFYEGELTCIIGPNGTGKSTLLGVLAGDVAPDAGEIVLGGSPLHTYRSKELARLRAVLPQDHTVHFEYAVEDVVELARIVHKTSPEVDEAIITESLFTAEVAHLRRRNIQTLSGGERARAGFARVIAQTTPVVFLDEPTAALDLRHQEVVLRSARELAREGKCVIVVVHDLNLAAAYADRILVLADQGVVADGPVGEVFDAERISAVYGQRVMVIEHPTRGCPVVLTTD